MFQINQAIKSYNNCCKWKIIKTTFPIIIAGKNDCIFNNSERNSRDENFLFVGQIFSYAITISGSSITNSLNPSPIIRAELSLFAL